MDGTISLENALNATNAMSLKPLKKPNVVDLPGGAVLPSDLPLVSLQDHGRARHVFDIVGMVNLHDGLKKDFANICKENRFHDLPAPFGFKGSHGALGVFQLAAIPLLKREGQSYLVKHITFREQVKAELAKGLCYGECHGVLWQGQNFKSVKKALQWMFGSLGGFQVLSFCLAPMGTQQHGTRTNFFDNLGNEEIDAGFDFIKRHGPRSHYSNTEVRWIQKQFISEDSPIKTWPKRLIKEAFKNLMNDGVLEPTCPQLPSHARGCRNPLCSTSWSASSHSFKRKRSECTECQTSAKRL